MSSQAGQTAAKWYQTKRIPLYAVVGGTWLSGVSYLLFNRSQHSQVESGAARQNELAEVEGSHTNAHAAAGAGHGATTQGSGMRHTLRGSGLMDGQATHGILPNETVANKLRDIVGHEHKEHEEVLNRKK